MIVFWIAAVLASGLALGLMAWLAARPVAVATDPSRTVYRRQLSEIDDLAERGLLGEEERASAHAEAARRLLSETDTVAEAPSPPGARTFVWGMALLTGVFAVVIYLLVGSPGAPDQPMSRRLAEWQAKADSGSADLDIRQVLALFEQHLKLDLRQSPEKREVAGNPGFYAAMADLQMKTGDALSAERNLERAVSMGPDNVDAWVQLGIAQMDLAEGQVTPKVRASFEKALALDPKRAEPRFFLANDAIEKGHKAEGLAALKALLPELSPEPQRQVAERIAEVEKGPAAAPSVATSPAVMAMVEGLAERLRTDPNDPAGWARLVHAYAVQNDTAKLNAALTEARRYFKNRPADLAGIEAAASANAPPQ